MPKLSEHTPLIHPTAQVEQVSFGRLSPADGGKQYVTEAKAILSRA